MDRCVLIKAAAAAAGERGNVSRARAADSRTCNSNDYYGAESASLNLTQVRVCSATLTARKLTRVVAFVSTYKQLYKKFRNSEPPAELGRDRDYAVDLIPKLYVYLRLRATRPPPRAQKFDGLHTVHTV